VSIALAVAAFALGCVCYAYGDRVYTATATVAFVVHLLAAALALNYLPYTWDIAVYHETALALLAGQQPAQSAPTIAFGRFIAALYSVFGPDLYVTVTLNSLLAVLLPFPVAVLARSLYPKAERIRGLQTLVLFLPLGLLFLSLPMRDTLAVVLFTTAAASVARALTDRHAVVFRAALALAAVPVVAALSMIRIELAGLTAAGGALGAVVLAVERYAGQTVSIPSLVTGVGATGLVGLVTFASRYDLSTLNYQLRIRGVGGAAYLTPFQYESWLAVLVAAPIRAIYFQFAPFPLHVDGIFDLLALLELPVLLALTLAAVHSLRHEEWETPVGALLGLAYVGGVVGYGLVDANFGTTVRHRIPFVVLLAVAAAPEIERWWTTLVDRLSGDRDHRRDDATSAD